LIILEIGFFLRRPAWTAVLFYDAHCFWDAPPHTLLFLLTWCLVNFLPGLCPNHNPPSLSLLNSRITGVSHRCLAKTLI
jgi:hypothetical protein